MLTLLAHLTDYGAIDLLIYLVIFLVVVLVLLRVLGKL